MTSTQTEHRGFATTGSAYYPTLVAVFTGLVLISNVAATKGIAFGPIIGDWSLITDGGFIVFPLTYVIGDVLSEVYGFAATRRAIYIAFVMEALAAVTFWLTAYLPAADFYTNQAAFEAVVEAVHSVDHRRAGRLHRRADAERLGVGADQGAGRRKTLWVRLIGSTVVGEFADTLVFCSIAAGAIGISTWRDFITYVALGWVYKTAVEVVVLPVTYRVIAFIKRREPTYQPAV